MSTKNSIAYDDKNDSFHLYIEMLDGSIHLKFKADEASLDSRGNLTLNLSKLPHELITALAMQLTKMAEGQK